MNNNSCICRFVLTHSDWRNILTKEYKINIDETERFAMFTAAPDADFSNLIVKEAYGIIIELETMEIVCWPVHEAREYSDPRADKINWGEAHIEEMVDGVTVNMWYDREDGEWILSTRDKIDAFSDFVPGYKESIGDLFVQSRNFIQYCNTYDLDEAYTYTFVVADARLRGITDSFHNGIYHIGTKWTSTGEGIQHDMTVRKPYNLGVALSLDCALRMCSKYDWKNIPEGAGYDIHKGIVVVDRSFNRVKVTTSLYSMIRDIELQTVEARCTLIDILRKHKGIVADLSWKFPERAYIFKYYDYMVTDLYHTVESIVKSLRELGESDCNQLIGEEFDGTELKDVVSKCVQSNVSTYSMLNSMDVADLEKIIPKYKSMEFTL